MKVHQTDFSTGNVYRNIMEVALPMIMAQLLNLLYNVVDRMYIGRIPEVGTMALTGVGLCFPIITLINAFTLLYGNGGAPLCAMERGRGNDREAGMLMGNSFVLLVGTGVVLTVAVLIGYRPVLQLFGASEVTLPYAADYIRIYLMGTVFVMIAVGMNPFINSQGFGNVGMLSVLIGAVINMILDPILIFGFHMGVRGAAVATVFSQLCSAVWVMAFLTGKKVPLRLMGGMLKLSLQRAKSIVALGVSGFIMSFTNSLVQVVCNTTLQLYGGDIYVGVMTVLNSVREICTLPVQGFTNGASPVMSFNYGERAYDKVKKAIKFITAVCVLYTLFIWGVLKVIPQFFIKIFNSDPVMIEKGVPALHIYFFGFCFMALQFTGQSVFVALGKSRKAVFFSLLRKAFIVVPLTLLLPRIGMGVDGVFWAEPISNLLGGSACFLTMLGTVLPELKRRVETNDKKSYF